LQWSGNQRKRRKVVRDIRRATRRQYSAEEKSRIVIAGLRGELSIAELPVVSRIYQLYKGPEMEGRASPESVAPGPTANISS
jgi:hypothetical protein